jgi:hypothetical protein
MSFSRRSFLEKCSPRPRDAGYSPSADLRPFICSNQHKENNSPWTSKETARSLRAKDPPSGLPALGQTLIVTSGCGRVQRWGRPIEEIRPGDVLWFVPGEKHWHGAAPLTAMTHIAIVKVLDGKSADWMEKVSDEQYQA